MPYSPRMDDYTIISSVGQYSFPQLAIFYFFNWSISASLVGIRYTFKRQCFLILIRAVGDYSFTLCNIPFLFLSSIAVQSPQHLLPLRFLLQQLIFSVCPRSPLTLLTIKRSPLILKRLHNSCFSGKRFGFSLLI